MTAVFMSKSPSHTHLGLQKLYIFTFHSPNTQIETMTLDLFDLCAKVGKDDTVDLSLMSSVEIIFKNAACINGSFLVPNGRHMCCSVKNPGVSIADAQRAFNSIQTMENITLKSIVS